MRLLSTLILVLLMLPATVQACWYGDGIATTTDYVCPIDGVKFYHTGGSIGAAFGENLDLRPLVWCWASPEPMGQCPNDGMIIYKDKFRPEEVAILKEYVSTVEYQQMVKGDTSTYWRAAKLQEKLGVPPNERWYTMLQATWEADSDIYELYARETINVIEALLADPLKDKKEKGHETRQLLLGELYRRVGDFDKAKVIFEGLMTQPAFKDHDLYPLIINYELELIAKKDQASHEKPSSKSTR